MTTREKLMDPVQRLLVIAERERRKRASASAGTPAKRKLPLALEEDSARRHQRLQQTLVDEVDRLLGLTLPEEQNLVPPLTAVELLAAVIQTSPTKVTLLTLGPLTNLAETL